MSIITSNQSKRQTVVDPILILFVSVLVVLLVFAFTVANRDCTRWLIAQQPRFLRSGRTLLGCKLQHRLGLGYSMRRHCCKDPGLFSKS